MPSMSIKLNTFYDDLTEQDVAYLLLRYDTCKYTIDYHDRLETLLINFDEPKSWPALFRFDDNGRIRYGVFESKKDIQMGFIERNTRRD
jgi:hypothetical protein